MFISSKWDTLCLSMECRERMNPIIPTILAVSITSLISQYFYHFHIKKSKYGFASTDNPYSILIAFNIVASFLYTMTLTENWIWLTTLMNGSFIIIVLYTLRSNKTYTADDLFGGHAFVLTLLFLFRYFL